MIILFSYIQKGLNIHKLNITKTIKKDYKKKFAKLFQRRKRKKSNIMVINGTKVSWKMKSKSGLSIKKDIIK